MKSAKGDMMKAVKKITWLRVSIPVPTVVCRMTVQPLLLGRRVKYGYAFRKIRLTQGYFAKVDQRDYEYLCRYKWCVNMTPNSKYARCTKFYKTGKSRTVMMHRLIMEPPRGYVVDHINGDGLDNRRANLRLATCAQNGRNRRKIKKGISRYKGVGWEESTGKWRARIIINRKKISLGCYKDEIAAARAYDKAAKKYHGEFARLNFPEK